METPHALSSLTTRADALSSEPTFYVFSSGLVMMISAINKVATALSRAGSLCLESRENSLLLHVTEALEKRSHGGPHGGATHGRHFLVDHVAAAPFTHTDTNKAGVRAAVHISTSSSGSGYGLKAWSGRGSDD